MWKQNQYRYLFILLSLGGEKNCQPKEKALLKHKKATIRLTHIEEANSNPESTDTLAKLTHQL
jgi:hypothetical protein